MIEIWFPFYKINFNREQMIWLIYWLDILEEGIWPPEPSGYTDTSSKGEHRADFDDPAIIRAVVTSRLEKTGLEGKLLVAEICRENTSAEELSYEARRALNYISGSKERRMSFQKWKAQRKYRQR